MRQVRALTLGILMGSLILLIMGCGSTQPSRFYTLTVSETSFPEQRAAEGIAPVVAIGPVNIPDYLDRPQIVTRGAGNEIYIAEFERWAGPLKSAMPRFLAQHISARVPADRFTVIPWRPVASFQIPVSYRIVVIVEEFVGDPGGQVVLKALWTVFQETDSTVVSLRESSYAEQTGGNDYGSLVAAMSRALDRLAHDMARAIETLPAEKPRS